jgi:hypothetical protein
VIDETCVPRLPYTFFEAMTRQATTLVGTDFVSNEGMDLACLLHDDGITFPVVW